MNKQIEEIFNNLSPFKKLLYLENQKGKANCYGCTKESAANNCISIQRRKPYRQNGFFWVKTECMPQAERVYCDFQTGDANLYFYYGHNQLKTLELNSIKQLQEHCQKIGLKSLEIFNKKQIETVMQYLNMIELDQEDQLGVPLAVSQDSEKFNPIGSSQDISIAIQQLTSDMSMIEKLLTIKADLVVYRNFRIQKDFVNKAKLKGMVCSQNRGLIQSQLNIDFFQADCQTQISQLNPSLYTIYKIDCNPNCGSQNQYQVYGGKEYYSEQSSICRSAIHFGAIKDYQGGTFQIKILKNQLSYSTNTNNEILSYDGNGSNDLFSFQIISQSLEKLCPNLKIPSQIFLSFENMTQKIQKNNQTLQDETLLDVSLIQTKEQIIDLQFEEAGGDPGLNIEQAKNYVNNALGQKLFHQDQYLKFIKDVLDLEKRYQTIIESIYTSTMSPLQLNQNIDITKIRIKAVQTAIDDLVNQGKIKLDNNLKQYLSNIDNLLYLQRFEDHFEEYQHELQNQYEIFDNIQASKGPSKWHLTTDDILPHKQAIYQQSEINCNFDIKMPDSDCSATILKLKHKKYYDFIFQIDFKVKKLGSFGLVFRYKDLYNYYALDILQETIQIRKMINGLQQIVASQKIQKIQYDIWYNLEMICEQSVFKISMGKEKKFPNKNYEMVVLKAEDSYLKQGFIGLQSDNSLGLYFDYMKVSNINCFKENNDQKIKYLQPDSSRFYETYKAQINQVWSQNYQQKWIYFSKYGRKQVIFKRKEDEEIKIILKNKVFKKGWIQFDFFMESEKTEIIFYFFYINEINYCELRIKNNIAKLSQIENSQQNLIIQREVEIEIKTWQKLFFESQDEIQIWIQNKQRYLLFEKPIDRPPIQKNFYIGFNLIKGSGAFDQIKLQPGTVPEMQSQDSAFIQTEDQIQLLPDEQNGQQNDQEEGIENGSQLIIDYDSNKERIISEQQFDYSQCVKINKKSDRVKWCEQRNIGYAVQNCYDNFCLQCCLTKVPKNKMLNKCMTECKPEQAENNNDWKQCYDSNYPKKSVQKICSFQFTNKFYSSRCKLDFCNLCCNLTPLMINQDMKESQIQLCYDKCYDKYHI